MYHSISVFQALIDDVHDLFGYRVAKIFHHFADCISFQTQCLEGGAAVFDGATVIVAEADLARYAVGYVDESDQRRWCVSGFMMKADASMRSSDISAFCITISLIRSWVTMPSSNCVSAS
jgi:hypothetical protein